MDHPAASQLDRFIHVDAQMLDRLKRSDELAELLSRLCVFNCHVLHGTCGTKGVGSGRDEQVVDHGLDSVSRRRGQSLRGDTAELDPKLLAGLVDTALG